MRPIKQISILNIILWLLWPLMLLLLLIVMFFTCGNKASKQGTSGVEQDQKEVQSSVADSLKEFPMVEIPSLLNDPAARANYLVTHYWDHFNFSDTSLIHLPEIIEQGFTNYLSVLPHASTQTASSSIKQMLSKSKTQDRTGKMYSYFLDQYKSYLHDPNSPFRNDEYYIPVTEHILSDSLIDEGTKERAQFDLKLMLKNRVGAQAADFSYLTLDHKKGTLHKLKKDYTLLYFHNPDCGACKEGTAYLDNSSLIRHLLKKGVLDILAVYPDEDLSLWQTHSKDIPPLWINARDEGQKLKNKQVYDLKAIEHLLKAVELEPNKAYRIEQDSEVTSLVNKYNLQGQIDTMQDSFDKPEQQQPEKESTGEESSGETNQEEETTDTQSEEEQSETT